MKKSDWIWMPHAGHLCVAHQCRFHLNTYVGGYIVSTVGEYFPDSRVRKIFAERRGIKVNGIGDEFDMDYMEKIGYETIGADRLYETMVFRAENTNHPKGNRCCPHGVSDWSEVDMDGYNTAEDAMNGHYAMCKKWSRNWTNTTTVPLNTGESNNG